MRLLSLSLICFLLSISCNKKEEGFIINGTIENIPDSSLITLYDIGQQIFLDSAWTKDGKFVLEGKIDQPTTCWLRNGEEYAIIDVENLEMSFRSPVKNMLFENVTIGGREQALRNELQALQRPYDLQYTEAVDSLQNQQYQDDSTRKRLIAKYRKNLDKSMELYIDFGKEHADSYLGLGILYANRKRLEKDSLSAIYEGLSPTYKQTDIAYSIATYLNEPSIKIGEPFIDFEAKNMEGEAFKLSSKKGKYIYLTFWSMGCGPCRMENKFFSEHYNDIPEELSIVSFSTDKNIEFWKRASEMDNILWDNVSDYAGDRGKVKTQYEVQAIPASFFINREGIVVKRFYGFDPEANIIEELKKLIEEDKLSKKETA